MAVLPYFGVGSAAKLGAICAINKSTETARRDRECRRWDALR